MKIQSTLKLILFFFSLSLSSLTFSQDVRVASWNLKDIFNDGDINNRTEDFKSFINGIKPDVLILQEFTNENQLRQIAFLMGFDHFASSNFKPTESSNTDRGSFEVGVLSKYPITKVIEYDPSIDKTYRYAEERELHPFMKGAVADVGTSRGFLWVEIEEINLIAIGVHLKSSSGRDGSSDKSNAQKRELVMATLASKISFDVNEYPEYSILVAGDFNVGHSDEKKVGNDLLNDCYSNCNAKDGYDDTHAMLYSGIINGLKMKNLTFPIKDTTYPGFAGSPIDNIYVIGKDSDKFEDAQKSSSTYGSDHLSVYADWKK